jgi:hypothetical protein
MIFCVILPQSMVGRGGKPGGRSRPAPLPLGYHRQPAWST